MPRLRLLAALLLAAIGLAAGPLPLPAPAPTHPPAVSPAQAQAQDALAILQDDKRRAELIGTLETIAKAEPAPAAQPALPLAPDSLGAEVVTTVSSRVAVAGRELVASLQSVNDLPMLWRWVDAEAHDPDALGLMEDAAWRVAVIFVSGLIAEWVVGRLLRRLRAAITAWSPHGAESEEPADAEPRPRPRGTLSALRRLPYLFGRLLLDLLPVAAFWLVSDLLLGTSLAASAQAGGAALKATQAYVFARIVLTLADFLVSPATPRMRLLHVTDWAAAFLTTWIRRVTVLGVFGYALTDIGLVFGMYQTAHDALLKLFSLILHLFLVIAVLQARTPVAARLRRARKRGVWAVMLSRFAEIWHLVAIFYIVALWVVWAIELRHGFERLLRFGIATTSVLMVGRLLGIVLLGGLDRIRDSLADESGRAGLGGRAAIYYPILRAAVSAILWVLVGFALLQVWGFDPLAWFSQGGLGGRVLSAALLLGITTIVAVAIWEAANAAIDRHLAQLADSAQVARAGRLRTLLPLLRTVLLITILVVLALMALSELGVNIAPLLAGAGVVGIAVGFGSQKLVQDLITGLFLLLENAMQVGDVVTVAGLSGTVEALSIRTIRLRALDGAVHLIPFSAVTTVTNQTRDYSYAVVDVSVGLNEEPDPIAGVLRDVARAMHDDPAWSSMVLDELDVMGVEKLTDLAWIMRVRIKTQPGSRWAVAREFNRRIKVRFDELAIESPFTSHRVLGREPPSPQAAAPAAAPEEQIA